MIEHENNGPDTMICPRCGKQIQRGLLSASPHDGVDAIGYKLNVCCYRCLKWFDAATGRDVEK